MQISDCTVKANKTQKCRCGKAFKYDYEDGRKKLFWTIFLDCFFLTADAPFKKCTQTAPYEDMLLLCFSIITPSESFQ